MLEAAVWKGVWDASRKTFDFRVADDLEKRGQGFPLEMEFNPKGDRLYVIVNGKIQIVTERPGQAVTLIAELGAGDCFGEMALVSDQPRNATARTAGPVDVLTVDREAFHALFAHLPPLRNLFQQLIAQRMQAAPNGGDRT
jgi:CRP-like cAMP-binding protein